MPTILYENRVSGILTSLATVPEATVTRQDTEQVAIVATTMVLDSIGMYSYTFSDPTNELEYSVVVKDTTSPFATLTTVEVFGATDISYGSITEGNAYFLNHLWADSWDSATNSQKKWALIEATSRLDALAYHGSVTVTTQTKQFPRDTLLVIPQKVIDASFDIALKLLEGYIPDEEAEHLHVSSEAYAAARITLNTESAGKPWIATGILSKDAWNKLVPYLLNSSAIRLIRAN